MSDLWIDVKWFLSRKIYIVAVLITAACSYGFNITHVSIGIDDTATGLYFQEGLAVVMGRWTIFLLNRIFPVAEYAPFIAELTGTFFMILAATIFCVLLKRICKENSTNIVGYTLFSCVFISNPIIGEDFIYYLHNGVGLGYVLCALSLIVFEQALEREDKKLFLYVISMVLILLAVGCYESFLVLYILGILVILFVYGMTHRDSMRFTFLLRHLLLGACVTIGCILLREVMIWAITEIFDLHGLIGLMNKRELSETLVLFEGSSGWNVFLMLVKRYWLVYYVNALCHLPVTGYVIATFVVGILSVVLTIKRRNFWFFFLFLGMQITPFLLTVGQASVTLYRSAQYLPFFTAFGAFMLYLILGNAPGFLRYAVVFLACILIYNQAAEMNHNFYVDYQKYEHTKDVLLKVAYDIESEYGTEKPVVFTGHYEVPYEFTKDYRVGYGSWQYRWIVRITDPIDPHLKEKYFTPHGYSFIGEAQNPFIQWAFDAFDGTNGQMIRFLEMHGHAFQTITDKILLEEARMLGDSMPRWPLDGSIVERENYIVIHM